MRDQKLTLIFALVCSLMGISSLKAANFVLPPQDASLIGYLQETTTRYADTLVDIARQYGVGYREITQANPEVDPWLPGEGTRVLLPTRYLLPDAPRKGIVLNLAEMRVYYYPRPQRGELPQVMTFPVSIGRDGWTTPTGLTQIVDKVADPSWYPPASIRAEHEAQGDPLPLVVPPGPDNPLGRFALRLGITGYLIHGTNKPYGIGMKVSHGCIRMHPDDIEVLFNVVPQGTPVRIVNQPYKAGWHIGDLYLEVHTPSITGFEETSPSLTELTHSLVSATRSRGAREVHWIRAAQIAQEARGIPLTVTLDPESSLETHGSTAMDMAPSGYEQ